MLKSYKERALIASNVQSQRLFCLMDDKKTNLGLAVDLTDQDEILYLADLLGPEICVFKTHVDIIENFTLDFTYKLKEFSEKHNFLIFEDRKFADIGNTVKLQYEKGLYHIVDWADIVNAHILPGEGIIQSLQESGLSKNKGLLLLAEMSSKEALFSESYTKTAVLWAEKYSKFVMGFISGRRLTHHQGFIHMTPGIHKSMKDDSKDQRYKTPEEAITQLLTDVILVGRGIYSSSDPLKEAKLYREAGWNSYKKILI